MICQNHIWSIGVALAFREWQDHRLQVYNFLYTVTLSSVFHPCENGHTGHTSSVVRIHPPLYALVVKVATRMHSDYMNVVTSAER
jgi:hypothetical protein